MDVAKEIRELAAEGFGRNQISSMTGIMPGTVRRIIEREPSVQMSDDLTTRQRSALLNSLKVPHGTI